MPPCGRRIKFSCLHISFIFFLSLTQNNHSKFFSQRILQSTHLGLADAVPGTIIVLPPLMFFCQPRMSSPTTWTIKVLLTFQDRSLVSFMKIGSQNEFWAARLEEVIKKAWQQVDPWTGPKQSEAPPWSPELGMHTLLPFLQRELFQSHHLERLGSCWDHLDWIYGWTQFRFLHKILRFW